MKSPLTSALWLFGVTLSFSQDRKEETRYLGFLHVLQYAETTEDVRKWIPDCPLPVADAGKDNTKILIMTKLFGHEARGEFNFHKGVLVSHGFEVLTTNYKDAHRTFLEAVRVLDSQVDGLETSVDFPDALDGGDSSDGPRDEISATVNGVDRKASFQLRLDMRQESIVVRWGAQRVER